jgi:hypothetical protein
MANKA